MISELRLLTLQKYLFSINLQLSVKKWKWKIFKRRATVPLNDNVSYRVTNTFKKYTFTEYLIVSYNNTERPVFKEALRELLVSHIWQTLPIVSCGWEGSTFAGKYQFKADRRRMVTIGRVEVAIVIENRTLTRLNQSNVIFETYQMHSE